MKLFNQDTKVEALQRAPLFEGLSRKELVALARVTEDVEVEAGKVIFKEGDIGQEFFVVIDGEAEVTRKGRRLETLKAGDFFGEISLLEDTRRMATVKSKTALRFFVLTRQGFRRLVDQHGNIERKLLRALARRILSISKDPTLA